MRRCDKCNQNWIKSIVNKDNPICPVCKKLTGEIKEYKVYAGKLPDFPTSIRSTKCP